MGAVWPCWYNSASTSSVCASTINKAIYSRVLNTPCPKVFAQATESYRLATEGMTTKSGTVVVDPREIDVVSLLINAMGLPASEINSLKWTKGQQYELQQYFQTERSKYARSTSKPRAIETALLKLKCVKSLEIYKKLRIVCGHSLTTLPVC